MTSLRNTVGIYERDGVGWGGVVRWRPYVVGDTKQFDETTAR